jgi:hypothetical protein
MGNSLNMCPDISKGPSAIYKALEMGLLVTAIISTSPKLNIK